MNDTVFLAALQAAEMFGGRDGVFNAVGFSVALARISNRASVIDGGVRAILSGRSDIADAGPAHYRILHPTVDAT
jgi:hypothetical protein